MNCWVWLIVAVATGTVVVLSLYRSSSRDRWGDVSSEDHDHD